MELNINVIYSSTKSVEFNQLLAPSITPKIPAFAYSWFDKMTSVNSDYNEVDGDSNLASLLQSDQQIRSAYILKLQRTIDYLRAQEKGPKDRLSQAQRSNHSGEQSTLPGQYQDGENNQNGWNLEIKRWKKVHNRNGFSEIYDESEKIEDIRKREREIRSGGTRPCVLILLDYDKADRDRLRSFRVRRIRRGWKPEACASKNSFTAVAGSATPSHHVLSRR